MGKYMKKILAAAIVVLFVILQLNIDVSDHDAVISSSNDSEKNKVYQTAAANADHSYSVKKDAAGTMEDDRNVPDSSDSFTAGIDYKEIISKISDPSYRESVRIRDDSFIIMRNEAKDTAPIEDTDWYKQYNVTGYEIVSEYALDDASSLVAYSLKINDSQDVWRIIDDCNSQNESLIAEPVYLYHLCDADNSGDYRSNTEGTAEEADPGMTEQWYMEDQGLSELYKTDGFTNRMSGEDVVVAVIDTGIDYTHEDLADNIWINDAEYKGAAGVDDDRNGMVDDIYGAAFDSDSHDPMDENGHGTHVAGIIAMSDNSKGGRGLCPNVKIMAVKAAGKDGVFQSTDVVKAIRYASSMGADVINMSFGAYVHSALVEEACQEAFGTSILVAAAGNEGYPTADAPGTAKGNQYPACYPYVLGVMAYDKNGRLASFSNWDYAMGEGPEYEIAAPGADMYSTLPGNEYGTKNGTSMAAAVVSATAAIVKKNLPDGLNCSSRYVMQQLLTASKQTVGKYKKLCIKDCYEYMMAQRGETVSNYVDKEAPEDHNDPSIDNDMNAEKVVLDSSISEDMTLKAGGYYIVDKAVVIEEGVTVNVEPGAKLQFWDGDPKQADADQPFSYIEVKGTMNFCGSSDRPIALFPVKEFGSYRVEIRKSGTVNMDYVHIFNPYVSIDKGEHLKLSQDYDTINYRGRDDNGKLHMYKGGALIEADSIRNSTMLNIRYADDSVSESMVRGSFDTVQFDNCCVKYDKATVKNSVFLGNQARIQNQSGLLEYISSGDGTAGIESMINSDSGNNVYPGSEAAETQSIYPYVHNIYITDEKGRNVSAVSDGEIKIHVLFNRSMDTGIKPKVSLGADDPYTDYVLPGAYVSDVEWVGRFTVNTSVYQGKAYLRVRGAAAASDAWLITGTDQGRFSFDLVPETEAPDDHLDDDKVLPAKGNGNTAANGGNSGNADHKADLEEKIKPVTMNSGLKLLQKGSKITVKWKKVSNADGYLVYVAYCGKKIGKPVKTMKNGNSSSASISKLGGKKINLKKVYKVYVEAYKLVKGKKIVMARTVTAYVVGRKSTKYTNVRKLTLSKNNYTVRAGKTALMRAKLILDDKGKKHIPKNFCAKLRYKSSNISIATVDKKGKIKGIRKGTCTIYVYSVNGIMKKAKVTVK